MNKKTNNTENELNNDYYVIFTENDIKICYGITKYIPCEPDGQKWPMTNYYCLNGEMVDRRSILAVRNIRDIIQEMGIKCSNHIIKEITIQEDIKEYVRIMHSNVPNKSRQRRIGGRS